MKTLDSHPPTVPDPLMLSLVERAAEVHERHVSVEALRQPVYDIVTALRSRRLLPEAVVVSVKAALRAGGLDPVLGADDPDSNAVALAVTWCVKEYFRDPS